MASSPDSIPPADASAACSQGLADYAAARVKQQPLFSEAEDRLADLLDQPNLAATVMPEGFKPSKLQMLDALIAAKARQQAAEIDQVALVSGLCDAYSCLEPNPGGDAETSARVLFGEHLLPPSMDGVPAIAEFFGHELGPALGISPDAAWALVWDVLALRHRHPILWEHTLTGQVEVWRARKVANACHGLTADLARQLDSELAPAMPGWGPVKTMTEVRDTRARLDPDAETKRQQARRARRVRFNPHEDAEGITELDALLDALDAHHLAGTINDLAHILKKGGAAGSLDELRATALGHLAHPDRAARLLQPDLLDGATVTPDGHIINTASGEMVTTATAPARCRHGATIIVHLSSADLACHGGAEIEGLGRITHAHLTELLTACAGFVRVRPVIDLAAPLAVATYRPSAEMVWRVKLRDGREMFPYSQRSTRSSRVDLDHTETWNDGGPTDTTNLGPNTRRTHRAQTHGDFTTTQESPGQFRWTTPLGKTYWTSRHGTFTNPPPEVVANEPCHTTQTILANLLQAAATPTPDTGHTIKQRARRQRQRRHTAAHPSTPPPTPAGRPPATPRTAPVSGPAAAPPPGPARPGTDYDPWQPELNNQPPPF